MDGVSQKLPEDPFNPQRHHLLQVSTAEPATYPAPVPGAIEVGGGALGSTEWIAITGTVPIKLPQCASPFASMDTVVGTEIVVNPENDQFTDNGLTTVGDAVKIPVAVNWTAAPFAEPPALFGLTVILLSTRVDPQPVDITEINTRPTANIITERFT